MQQNIAINVACAVGGVAIGGVGTYFALKSRMRKKMDEAINEEVATLKAHYKGATEEAVEKAKETYAFVNGSDEEAARIYIKRMNEAREMVDYTEQIQTLNYGDPSLNPEELRVVNEEGDDLREAERRVSDEALALLREKLRNGTALEEDVADDSFKVDILPELKEEVTNRSTPYVIPIEEFNIDEEDYAKLTVTYFEKDDTLVDERNSPIPDVEGTVGADFFNHFGDRSESADIVYIRNHRLEADFEVVRNEASFTNTILGIPDDDDNRKPIKRMREDG